MKLTDQFVMKKISVRMKGVSLMRLHIVYFRKTGRDKLKRYIPFQQCGLYRFETGVSACLFFLNGHF